MLVAGMVCSVVPAIFLTVSLSKAAFEITARSVAVETCPSAGRPLGVTKLVEEHPRAAALSSVSYTHLTLPTIA